MYRYTDILFQFFAGYLGMDWPDDFGSWQEAIAEVKRQWPIKEQQLLVQELRQEFLNTGLSDDNLKNKAYALGFNYLTEVDGLSFTQWLEQAIALLEGK